MRQQGRQLQIFSIESSFALDDMKVLGTILYAIFITFVIGIAGLVLGTMLPIPGNIEIKIVKSGSMEPTIPTGSIVLVQPKDHYLKGDIVTFGKDTSRDIPTTHRIIAVTADGSFVTKGDANEEADQNPAPRNSVIGKVILHVPGAGFVLDFARTKLGFALLIGIPAALVILEELLTIAREAKKWYRGGGRSGGSPDLRTHLKRAYEKRRAMDEIKVAIYREPHWYEAGWWRRRLGLDRDAYGTSTSLTVSLVFFAMIFAGHSGGTLSYFSDIERSMGNLFVAWTAPVEIMPFALTVTEDGDVLGTMATESDALSGEDASPSEELPTTDVVEEVTDATATSEETLSEEAIDSREDIPVADDTESSETQETEPDTLPDSADTIILAE